VAGYVDWVFFMAAVSSCIYITKIDTHNFSREISRKTPILDVGADGLLMLVFLK
jgi:hypothetical protein